MFFDQDMLFIKLIAPFPLKPFFLEKKKMIKELANLNKFNYFNDKLSVSRLVNF